MHNSGDNLSDSSKYDHFMDELNALEKQVYVTVQRRDELVEENKVLLEKIEDLEKENEVFKLKYEEIQSKFSKISTEGLDFSNEDFIDPEEREKIKNKISDLISKIDYHLRS